MTMLKYTLHWRYMYMNWGLTTNCIKYMYQMLHVFLGCHYNISTYIELCTVSIEYKSETNKSKR